MTGAAGVVVQAAPVPRRAWVLLCRDNPAAHVLRGELLAAHLDFVAANIDRYLVAGPLSPVTASAEKGATCGSLFVVHASDEADLYAFMSGDPYYASGLYEHTQAFAFEAAAGSAVGGCCWLAAAPLPGA